MAFTLPPLPYAPDALEPFIDAQTMQIHHGKHHQAYVDNLNKALAGTDGEGKTLEEIMANISAYPAAVRNNGGGHYNHTLFWSVLAPAGRVVNGGTTGDGRDSSYNTPTGELAEAIAEAFGSLDALKEKMNAAGATRFGSGWAWLIVIAGGKLDVTSTPNQDNPLMEYADTKGHPIFGIDVWEHAYYLKYQNRRPDYLGAVWSVVNWDAVAARYAAAKS